MNSITCPKHGDFYQRPNSHLQGKGCKFCGGRQKFNTNEFIENAKKVHGDKYTYNNVDYNGSNEPVIITCPKHGDFFQTANTHLQGSGCKDCQYENLSSNNDVFIEKAKQVHGDKYSYDKVDYKKSYEPVIITCPKHGDFYQMPTGHLQGKGCKDCYLIAKKVHGDKYTYDKVDYKKTAEPVIITCPKHGDFYQRPNSHLVGNGCPTCSESKGELIVTKILNTLEIQFVREKKFEDCNNLKVGRSCRILPFDFYLPEFNTVIEYDGEQHYEPVKRFGGEERLKKTQINDEIKNKYCKDNGIKMIRIPYTIKFDDILPLLKNELQIK